MRVVVTGGTGFLGRHLRRALEADGHDVVIVSRSLDRADARAVSWEGLGAAVDGADAVVHLAGATIGRRWTAARKREILDSRVESTRKVTLAVRAAARPPRVVVSQSAVGYYGPRGDEEVAEDEPAGDDYLARVCRAWEREIAPLGDVTRLVVSRTGLPLARDGGVLARMWPPFRLGLGGPVGSGRQAFPWIHLDDWTGLVRFAIATDAARGPVNATAPGVVTNREFARAFGRALGRPAILPLPAFVVRAMFGEMAGVLLTGQRAAPRRALAWGYEFRHADIDSALAALVAAGRAMPPAAAPRAAPRAVA